MLSIHGVTEDVKQNGKFVPPFGRVTSCMLNMTMLTQRVIQLFFYFMADVSGNGDGQIVAARLNNDDLRWLQQR